jgi:arogenate dehydrogenase (NADP+), plant
LLFSVNSTNLKLLKISHLNPQTLFHKIFYQPSVNSAGSKRIYALDAAMPFDYEARAKQHLAAKNTLTIGIVGFGTFGQFLAKRLVAAGHTVLATSRSPYNDIAASMGVQYFQDADDFCEAHPDVVILATSILSLEKVLASLPVQRLKRSTLIVDVLSVKEFPKQLLSSKLPSEFDILCTHPMFGPDSGKGSWDGLNFMYEKVRVGESANRTQRCQAFLDFFANEGCNMVEMTCEDHDLDAASTQFITHTVGRMLGAMGCSCTPIDTKGYRSLLSLVENTANDSFELYYGLFLYNPNATEQLEKLEKAFDSVKRQLFTQLHGKLREEMGLVSSSSSSSSSGSGSPAAKSNGSNGNGSGPSSPTAAAAGAGAATGGKS